VVLLLDAGGIVHPGRRRCIEQSAHRAITAAFQIPFPASDRKELISSTARGILGFPKPDDLGRTKTLVFGNPGVARLDAEKLRKS
jgi:hypothetical protein